MKPNKMKPSWQVVINNTSASVPEPDPKNGVTPVTNNFIEWIQNNSTNSAADDIVKLLEERRQFGLEKYGIELHTFNGRNAVEDIRQELGDLIIYFAQLIMENKTEEANELLSLTKKSISIIKSFLSE